MNAQALDRLRENLHSRGITAAILSNPFTLTWLTGYAPPIQTGPSPFEGGPALGWWRDGELTLVLSDWEASVAEAAGANVSRYDGYSVEKPLDCTARQASVLRELLREHASLTRPVGVEMNFLPAAFVPIIHRALPKVTVEPLDGSFDPLRAVKTPEEITKIRAALKLCDLAQADICANVRPGITELELWGAMKGCIEIAAGKRLPILADLVAGARTAEIGGPPGVYPLQPGDPIIFDIVPRLDGYWGDSATTCFVGTPSTEMAKIFGVVRDALQRGIDAVRPGLRACDLDSLLRNAIRCAGYEPYPHHSGHGLGTAYHEEPRIVPYNQMLLETEMVIALEPGIYLAGVGGVRLEDTVLVTPDGCEVLTRQHWRDMP